MIAIRQGEYRAADQKESRLLFPDIFDKANLQILAMGVHYCAWEKQ